MFAILMEFFVKVAITGTISSNCPILSTPERAWKFSFLSLPLTAYTNCRIYRPGAFMNTWSKLKLAPECAGGLQVSESRGSHIPCSPQIPGSPEICFMVRSFGNTKCNIFIKMLFPLLNDILIEFQVLWWLLSLYFFLSQQKFSLY